MHEPEGGKRCEVCFRIRLQTTYNYMLENDFDVFTTTLTIGPQKSAEKINRIGREIGGNKFLVRDFKKKVVSSVPTSSLNSTKFTGKTTAVVSIDRESRKSDVQSILSAAVLFDNFIYGRR